MKTIMFRPYDKPCGNMWATFVTDTVVSYLTVKSIGLCNLKNVFVVVITEYCIMYL